MNLSHQVARSVVDAVAARLFKNPLIDGRGRTEPEALRRAEVMHALRRIGMTQEEVGEVFQRDHTTVASACKRIEERKKTHLGYDEELDQLYGFVCRLVADKQQGALSMLPEKVIRVEELSVARTPDGGGVLRIGGKDKVQLLVTEGAWKQLEESVRWHANGGEEAHANGTTKPADLAEVWKAPTVLDKVAALHDARMGEVETRLSNAEERLKDVERRVARVEGPNAA